MSVQGDAELSELVSQALENAGVLAKLRAELRASVFFVLEKHEAFKGENLVNKPLMEFSSTAEGAAVVNLVREFLEFFGLEFTASVFDPETQRGKDYEYIGRNKLAHDLKLNSGKKTPLIAQVLQESKICLSAKSPAPKEPPPEILPKKDKKEDAKPRTHEVVNNSKADATYFHTNGNVRSPESVTKDSMMLENKPQLLTSPPSMTMTNHARNSNGLKLDLNQLNFSSKPPSSPLSSLSTLPPLTPPHHSLQTQKTTTKGTKPGVSNDIKALLDLGSDSPEHNYEEDFQPSGSEKSKGTNKSVSGSGSEVEIEEEMSVGSTTARGHSKFLTARELKQPDIRDFTMEPIRRNLPSSALLLMEDPGTDLSSVSQESGKTPSGDL